jgi:hypothetical protein
VFWTTPITSRQAGDDADPRRIRRPSAAAGDPKIMRAALSFSTVTGNAAAESRASNARPPTSGIASVSKKSAVTSCALMRSAGVESSAPVRTDTGGPLDSGGEVPAATRSTPGRPPMASESCRTKTLRVALDAN